MRSLSFTAVVADYIRRKSQRVGLIVDLTVDAGKRWGGDDQPAIMGPSIRAAGNPVAPHTASPRNSPAKVVEVLETRVTLLFE
jgi:hypothetical protein